MLDLEKIRNETPNCQDKIFVNSAGSSLMPEIVLNWVNEYLNAEEKFGGYKVAEIWAEQLNEFYSETAKLVNAHSQNIAFAFNATDAYAKALSAINFKAGDVILTTDDDYVSNYINFIALERKFGIKIVRGKNLENGDLDIGNFSNLMDQHQPVLVAVTHIPTNSGLIQDVEVIGALCHKNDVLYLVDACQSVGQIPVDVQKINCDFLSATGRKFLRGPRGTGFLYVSDRVLQQELAPLFVDLRGAKWTAEDQYTVTDTARRFETWEIPYAFLIGLSEAIKYANQLGMEAIENYNHQLMTRLRSNLSGMEDVETYDLGSRTGAILTFRKNDRSREEIKKVLDANQVFFSITEKGNALIDFNKKGIDWVVRISPHYFNTLDEMDRLSKILESI